MNKVIVLTLALIACNVQTSMEDMYRSLGYDLGAYVMNISDSYTLQVHDMTGISDHIKQGEAKWVVIPVEKTITMVAFDKNGMEVDRHDIVRSKKAEKVFEINVGRVGKGSISISPQISVTKLNRKEANAKYPTLAF